ncbi:integrase core domain-containing protein [Diaphorobacter sp.]|uniref:integrase core domain-containing protein n=1 Tax=Diaphorobacter sp. TaxID=1934310 RepID=UPI00338E2767
MRSAAVHASGQRSKFVSQAILTWVSGSGIATVFNDPGKPWQNGTDESFNGKFCDEYLSIKWFRSRREAPVLIETWCPSRVDLLLTTEILLGGVEGNKVNFCFFEFCICFASRGWRVRIPPLLPFQIKGLGPFGLTPLVCDFLGCHIRCPTGDSQSPLGSSGTVLHQRRPCLPRINFSSQEQKHV